MSAARIDVKTKPGLVLLEVAVGPLFVCIELTPRAADSLAGAVQRGAIEACAPKLQLVGTARPDRKPVDLDPPPPVANT